MKRVNRVAFDQVIRNIDDSGPAGQARIKDKEDVKPLWYSREELVKSCLEAKSIVKMISAANGDLKAIDHSQICVVGLEKFHGKKERDKYRKLLVKSVLIRQEMNRGLGIENDAHSLCEISEMISASFKEFALWQAAMHRFHANEPSSPVERTRPSDSPPPHQAKRQKLSNLCSQEDLQPPPLSTKVELRRSQSQQLLAEMQHFVEGYCSR